jgi:hypothetical protein
MIDININETIYQLITNYPELKDVLYDLGFKDIVKPGMLQTMGRIMTLKKGAVMKNKSIDEIKSYLFDKGYNLKEDSHE